MNILLVSGPGISLKEPYSSGIETFMVSLADRLIGEGHVVDVVAHDAEARATFKLVNPFTGRSLVKLGFIKRFQEKLQFKKLDVGSYDLIHYHMFYPHLLKAGMRFNKPSLLTLHSPADSKRIAVYQKLSQKSDLTFVAVSKRIKQQWDSALRVDMPLIDNGINMDVWPTKNSADREYLLWSARINEQKNVADAIRVARHMQLPLKIAGKIADQHYFNVNVKPHLGGLIEYVGHVNQRELNVLAKKAIAYLATATWQEPFGLAALEMLASGVPVVGYHTAVPPDWENESVLITKSNRWQNLIALVEKSHTVSAETCNAFASGMNIQAMTSKYVKLYQQMLSKKQIIGDVTSSDPYLVQPSVEQTQVFN